MIIEVPFISQQKAPPEWRSRACGIACAMMALEYIRKKEILSFDEIIKKGLKEKGYQGGIGWKHNFLACLGDGNAEMKDFKKVSLKGGIDQLALYLWRYSLPIVSVTSDNKKDSHLIILVGVTQNADDIVTKFHYHDPKYKKEKKGAYREMDIEIFKERWRQLAIIFNR